AAGTNVEAQTLLWRAEGRVRLGDLAGADSDLRAAQGRLTDLGRASAHRTAATVALDRGDLDRAMAELDGALRLLDAIGTDLYRDDVLVTRAEVHRRRGEADAALADLARMPGSGD